MATTRPAIMFGCLTLVTVGLSYCAYFDHKRRNDPVFRKKLLREQRRSEHLKQARGKHASEQAEEMLAAAVAAVNAEPLPTTPFGKESFFMEQVGIGEMLVGRMPQGAVPAAIAFFKAYKVYPSPQELMMIYQRALPAEVFAIVVEMIKVDVTQTIQSSKSSSFPKNSFLSPDGPLIEEITGKKDQDPKKSHEKAKVTEAVTLKVVNLSTPCDTGEDVQDQKPDSAGQVLPSPQEA